MAAQELLIARVPDPDDDGQLYDITFNPDELRFECRCAEYRRSAANGKESCKHVYEMLGIKVKAGSCLKLMRDRHMMKKTEAVSRSAT